jgi:uncharacterized membrane protein YoaK (UPF0700 family)
MFCITVLSVKVIDQSFVNQQKNSYHFFLIIMFLLFMIVAVCSYFYLPFPKYDTVMSFTVGMLLVAAMAIQNAMHRIHWTKESPTTVMTGSTTQLMLNIAELFSKPSNDKKDQIQQRIYPMLPTMLNFAFGCAVAAILYKFALLWLFAVPPALLLLIYINRENYQKA